MRSTSATASASESLRAPAVQVAAYRPRAFVMMRVCRQTAIGEVDARSMESVVRAYVPYMESVIAHFENVSRQFLGYEVKRILLLHANELNADHVGDLIAMFRNRGYRFIPLDEALQDPAFALRVASEAARR